MRELIHTASGRRLHAAYSFRDDRLDELCFQVSGGPDPVAPTSYIVVSSGVGSGAEAVEWFRVYILPLWGEYFSADSDNVFDKIDMQF